MKHSSTLSAILMLGILSVPACKSSDERTDETIPAATVKTVLFDGNFNGRVNSTDVSITVQNNNGQVNGTYKDAENTYTLTGTVSDDVLRGKMDNGLFNFNYTGYYQDGNFVFELDKEMVALMRIAILATGSADDAAQMEGKVVLRKL